jgi:hypothetical protein
MKKIWWVMEIIAVSLGILSSCTPWQDELGKDLLPAGDKVFLYQDTLFDIRAYPVSGTRMQTSDRSYSSEQRYLLGHMDDTIVGHSDASIFTHFNTTSTFKPAPNTEIDSILFYLYVPDYFGNASGNFTIRVYEATETFYMDSIYYSDYETEGRYDPDPLAELTYTPGSQDTVVMLIRDQDFIQKFLDVQTDTALFRSDSLFKEYFKGFYLTASSDAEGGTIARVGLSDPVSRMLVEYANDSTEVDSTVERDFKWATFGINEYVSQKINVFEHDFSGTYLGEIIDRDSIETPICYVQGMAGVDTKLEFADLENWVGEEEIAINSARLVLDLVPEEMGGLDPEEVAQRLIIFTELEDGSLQSLYDYYAVYESDDKLFGGILSARSRGMFYDTTYTYVFNMGLHFQAMIDGVKTDREFRVQLYDALTNPKITKIWSNLYGNPYRIRLEVVFLKL